MGDRRQERKVVTVLFCDLVGFTQRAEEMDPEDVASLLTPYHARLKTELERYGGTVEKFIGDAVMALFGAPTAHEDDPERAVRSALAIRDFATEEGIELRIGITTGEALVTLDARPEHGQTMATGDVVNTAARLQAAAPVNGILVSGKTYDATKDAIEYEPSTPVEAKGKSKPVVVWRAERARSRITLDRLHATPLVGRSSELDALVGVLARARAERQPQLVTLVGVPGIGKSRLVYELSQAVDRDPELISWRQGRCLPYGEGVTFWALGEIVKAQTGILETDDPSVVEDKLALASSDEWVRAQLRPLVGLSTETREESARDEAFAAWRRFFEEVALERPLIAVFEDLHWADENLLDFVDHLAEWATGVALVVVCTARPELLERRPGWGGGKTNALTISLSRLSDDDTARLVGGLLQRAVMPADAQEAVLARAGGNPLYAEQYARLLEERLDVERALPETVQGIIAGRLDLLESEQKSVLQNAAVVGKVFWLGALSAISGAERRDLDTHLHALERKGFVRREPQTTIEGDTEYSFLHVLVREVAYAQIPRAPRAEKHRLTAEWIESLGRSDDHSEVLAHHYAETLDLVRAAEGNTTPLEEPARRAFRIAGERASALNAHAAAVRFYERALELWPHDPDRPRLLLQLARAAFLAYDEARTPVFDEARDGFLAQDDLESAAEAEMAASYALFVAGQVAHALDRAEKAAQLLQERPASRQKAHVLAERARMAMVRSQFEDALRLAGIALAVAEEAEDEAMQAHVLHTRGFSRVVTGDHDGLEDIEESLRLGESHFSAFDLQRVLNNAGFAHLQVGRIDRGSEFFETSLENALRYGLSARWPTGILAANSYWLGDWTRAEQRLDEFFAEGETPHVLESAVVETRGRIRLARDDLTGATEDCARAFELLEEDDTAIGPSCLRAQIALAEGRSSDAREDVARLLALGGLHLADELAHAVEVALLAATVSLPGDSIGDAAEDRRDVPWLTAAAAIVQGRLEEGSEQLHELQMAPLEAWTRLLWAARLSAERRRREADTQLQKALAFYRSVDATRYIREAEGLLAATA